MGKTLLLLGNIFAVVSVLGLYILLFTIMDEAEYRWQSILCVLAMIGISIVLMFIGTMIC
jgi:hypothetical protein